LALWRDTFALVGRKYPGIDSQRRVHQTISHLIGLLIDDVVRTTTEKLSDSGITTLDDVRSAPKRVVAYSDEISFKNKELKRFLYNRLYCHDKVERMRVKAERFLTLLFETYQKHPTLLPHEYRDKYGDFGTERVICDYIAGMTDRYALDEYKRLFDPYERV
ncbi:MAG TPA: deoxyguanosinetriphosphate triphosphohydrolase, partial [Desulfuromonadales bacterium]|nr:deoxyguanosinetriphosphate triphosphohydrolase [Desulfuromonadales bacterium]